MRKFKLLVIALACLFLVGCATTKEPITGDEFVERTKKAGFTAIDIKESYSTFATNAYLINSDFKAIFIESRNVYDVEGVFLDECKNVNFKLTQDAKIKNDSGKNWASYYATDIGQYFYVAFVDNTYLYVEGKEDNKERIESFIDSIGY